MASYKYKAATLNGTIKKGLREASDEIQLKELLRSEKLYLISCTEFEKSSRSKRLKDLELSDFFRQMSAMFNSGISIFAALDILTQRELPPNLAAVVSKMQRLVKIGTPLSGAMKETNGAFPQIAISMVEAGEAGGNSDQIFGRLANHFENENKTSSTIKGAMTYPIILVCLLIAAIIAIFTFILPRFMSIFNGMEVEMPLPTRIVLAISNFFTQKWYILIMVVFVLYILISALLSMPKVQIFLTKQLLHAGKIGHLLSIIFSARFCRTFSSMYSSGLSIISACQISRSTIGCPYIASQFDKVISDIRQGCTISDSIGQVDGFDIKLKSTIHIGEESGSLENMLNTTADAYEYESEQSIKKLTSLIEPIMICFMGVIIAFVFVSVMLPIYNLYAII